MDEIELSLHAAWKRIARMLADDPAALQSRIDRAKNLATLSRPPRAWCLAIRAADTRLDRFTQERPPTCPQQRQADDAAPFRSASSWRDPLGNLPSQEVLLDRNTIAQLCAPVTLTAPGDTLDVIAQRLGTTRSGLLSARVAGVLRAHYVNGLDAHFGKPHPLLYTDQPLDPATRGFAAPDPVWSWTASYLPSRLPHDFEPQELIRVPHYFAGGAERYRDTDQLHPEHPARDFAGAQELRDAKHPRRSLALPKPPPDFVAYKWKDGTYLGYDWRNPSARAGFFKKQRQLEKSRAAVKRRRARHPAPSQSSGSLQFRGWRWQCPRCGKQVNVLFLPVPAVNLLRAYPAAHHPDLLGISNVERRVCAATFACERCTRIRRFSRCDPNAWNEIVTYLSGGLLFGREVERPTWWPKLSRDRARSAQSQSDLGIRKLDYAPRPTRAPSRRRPQIEAMLLSGMSFKDIAATLRTPTGKALSKGTVLWYAQQIYKQHGVRTLNELLCKHGRDPKLTRRAQVKRRWIAGQSVAQIACAMQVSRASVYNHIYMLRKTETLARRCAHGDKNAVTQTR